MYIKSLASGTRPKYVPHWIKRMGLAGFLFFFLKGMLWLLIPWLAQATLF